MKQLWLGIGLAALILIGGLWLNDALEKTHHPQAKDLDRAAEAVRQGDWAQGSALLKRAQRDWEKSRNLAAALIHHGMVNEIDAGFAQLLIFAEDENEKEFRAGCAGLALQLRNLSQIHGLAWWSLL